MPKEMNDNNIHNDFINKVAGNIYNNSNFSS